MYIRIQKYSPKSPRPGMRTLFETARYPGLGAPINDNG